MSKSKKKTIQKRIDLLKLIKSIPSNKRASILNILDEESIHSICEVLHNLFKNNFGLNLKKCKHIRHKYAPHKTKIKVLMNPKASVKRKRQILSDNQIGSGLFTVLASVAIPALISALTSK